jgi:hypothetical protein
MFLRRGRSGGHRYVFWQVGLFFLASGVWLGGLLTGSEWATLVAIGLVVAAMILGLIGRRTGAE